MKMFRGCVAAALLGVALLTQMPARAADSVSIGTVGSASSNLWPVYIGIKKGFFDAANLKVDIIYVASSANLVQQLAAGSLDITMSTGLVDPIRAIDAERADLHRSVRGAGAALCAGGEVEHQEACGPQGQGHFGRRCQGHHPHLCRTHAGAARRQAGRVRYGVRGCHLGARFGAACGRRRCGDPSSAVQLPGRSCRASPTSG